MTRQEIATIIERIGLPYAYSQFDDMDGSAPQGPPFICFFYPGNDDLMADNINYAKITRLVIELYTDDVNFDLEDSIEAALTEHSLPYVKDQDYIDSERMYKTTYTTEVPING